MTARKPKELHKKTGRPSSYKPEYCQMLIDHMRAGYSFDSFGAVIDHTDDCLRDWENSFPDFAAAKKKANQKSLYFWEDLGIKGTSGKIKDFNSTVWIFTMKNRFGYRDKVDSVEINFHAKEVLEEC